MKQFSQNAEQDFILDYYQNKPNGKFIDIGAYDIERFSNTRALYLRGWKGIFVEPQPENFNAIYEHYKNDPNITTLNCAIGDKNGEIDFYESNGDAVGTTNEEHMEKWAASGVKYTKIKVPEIDVVDFMNEHCVGVDFISLDTESTNMTLFRRIPDFVFQQISMFCIEYDNGKDEVEERLSKFGFNTLYVNAENILLAK